jgi:hypothetical protein
MKCGRLDPLPAIVECVYGCQNALLLERRLGPRVLAVRDARYKLILNFREQTERMFDLDDDPAESKPLHESVCKGQRAKLLRVALQHLSSAQRDAELRLRARIHEIGQMAARVSQEEDEFAVANAQ